VVQIRPGPGQQIDEDEFMTIQTAWPRRNERSPVSSALPKFGQTMVRPEARRPFVYAALVAFSALYYYRPEDFIPGLSYIPMAKIAGILGSIALLGGMMTGGKMKIPRAVTFLWLLLLQMTLCIPFAIWRGGAFSTTFEKFSKGVVVAMLISMAVVTLKELRKLLWISVSAVALVTAVSILVRHYQDNRLEGIQKSILENPNDLAVNIAINFPLAVVFLLHAKGLKKALWGLAVIFMSLGIVLTYSRSGLLAFILSIMICVWEYGIKGKRRYVVGVAVAALVVGMGVALSSGHYRARVESIFMGNIEGSGDKGSLSARKTLLIKSLGVAARHPIFGVGPGCFPILDKTWLVTHNTYTELAAEAGLPALTLFLLAIWAAFKNIGQVRKSQPYREDMEFRLFTQALWAALAAYLLGACFESTEYNLYPYFMVGYTCAMVRIMNQPEGFGWGKKKENLGRLTNDRFRTPAAALSR
jgi:hypothetical protein